MNSWTHVSVCQLEDLTHLGHVIILFNFLMNCCTVFHRGYPIHFTLPPTVDRVPIALYPHKHLLFSGFMIVAILYERGKAGILEKNNGGERNR